MIYVEMTGRCGNQLFHYACARYVSVKTKDNELILNFNTIFSKNKKYEGWDDCLKDFCVIPYSYYSNSGKVLVNETNMIQKFLCAFKLTHIKLSGNKSRSERARHAQKYQKLLNWGGVYWIREGVSKIYPYKRNKLIVTGACENSSIFDEIGDLLRNELQPKYPVLETNKLLLKQIIQRNSICVSVRRGDFFNRDHIKSFGVCTPKYYMNAVEVMDKKVNNPVYFIFSDDIAWCKENIKISENAVYVSQDMPIYETLRLMYSCKHFIISNSTYSWWGQYLSQNKEKIVISPDRWNNDEYTSGLIDKSWILIQP